MRATNTAPPRVALFVTCLVDLFRPNVGFAAVRLLEAAGCRVEVPEAQTCCGQPPYNSGDRKDAQDMARQTIAACRGYDYVVAPSGSCIGMLRDYPRLFAHEPDLLAEAQDLAARSFELTQFLVDVRGLERIEARYPGSVTYHDACSGLRQLGVRGQPRALLAQVEEARLEEMRDTEVCCGFGGTFCVKYPELSARMANDKIDNICATGADTVLAGDLGCLMHIAGRLRRLDKPVRAYHIAEVLADMAYGPAIGEEG